MAADLHERATAQNAGLRLGPELSLPLEAVTQTFALLGKRGSGKTHTASVLVEEMLKAGLQVVVLDPLDVWWGLRASADGRGPGLAILILGGSHGDLPLDAHMGQAVADLVAEEKVSCVLSLRHLRKGEQQKLVTDFAERLYQRKGEDRYRQPLHVVIDEADAFAPQRVFSGQERMVGAIDDLVRRGRASGIGVTLITQRAAVINKDVLTQTEVLVAMRLISPQDRRAVEAWIEAHDVEGRREEFMASLASLPVGMAWVWSPGWLDLFRRVRIRRRETYDSSATPRVEERPREPAKLASLDLGRIRERLGEVLAKAASDDPARLRHRIAELERQLAARPASERVIERVEVPVVDASLVERLREVAGQLRVPVQALQAALDALVAVVTQLQGTAANAPARSASQGPPEPGASQRSSPEPEAGAREEEEQSVGLRAGERRMLAALARRHPMRLSRRQLGTLSGLSPGGGTFNTYLSALRRHGLVAETPDGLLEITPAGVARLGEDRPSPPSGPHEVLEMWRGVLRAGERRMLQVLVDVYPAGMTRAELGERTGIAPAGGTFGTYLSTLRRNGLVEVNGDEVRASPTLFL